MKRFLVLTAALMMTASMSMAADLVGYLTDAKCAAAGKYGAGHESCAQACVKGGQAVALVTEADGKVYKIANQDSVTAHVGHKVTVTAQVEGDSITVESVKM